MAQELMGPLKFLRSAIEVKADTTCNNSSLEVSQYGDARSGYGFSREERWGRRRHGHCFGAPGISVRCRYSTTEFAEHVVQEISSKGATIA